MVINKGALYMWAVCLLAFGIFVSSQFITIPQPQTFLAMANETAVEIGGFCSGTVINSSKGLIVTAAHCAEQLKKTYVRVHAGRTITTPYYAPVEITLRKFDPYGTVYSTSVYTAMVVGSDSVSDVAILRVSKPFSFSDEAKLSSDLPKFGDRVITVGHPLLFPTVISTGTISQPNVLLPSGTRDLRVIMFTAIIDRGSSGGALYNEQGELIGITNWRTDGGESFASPISNVIALLKTLKLNTEN